jgi:hypothetical protein
MHANQAILIISDWYLITTREKKLNRKESLTVSYPVSFLLLQDHEQKLILIFISLEAFNTHSSVMCRRIEENGKKQNISHCLIKRGNSCG